MPLEPGKPILAKISTRNLFWRTLTEPRAPQMTWLWNWSNLFSQMQLALVNKVQGRVALTKGKHLQLQSWKESEVAELS